ncbi:3116_t:CDS:2, partial [Paraglomus occultum]
PFVEEVQLVMDCLISFITERNPIALASELECGRAWRAAELRRKSFEDLHKLWYVLLKERNMLATMREEARRINMPTRNPEWYTSFQERVYKCQKGMARIKGVLNERRVCYIQAKRRDPEYFEYKRMTSQRASGSVESYIPEPPPIEPIRMPKKLTRKKRREGL